MAGPVGIVKMTGEAARSGFETLLSWLGLISINIAIINLIPFPALDGSRLAFLSLEAIRRKPIDRRKEAYIHLVGFFILILFLLVITYNDILRLLQ